VLVRPGGLPSAHVFCGDAVTAKAVEEGALEVAMRLGGFRGEATWPAALAVVAAIVLQLLLPQKLVPGTRWVLPALEVALLLPLAVGSRYRHHRESAWARMLAITLIAVINLANLFSLVLLTYYLVHGGKAGGHELILAAIDIWLTNIVVFGLWFWEIDRGGPGARTAPEQDPPEFLFPQMQNPSIAPKGWRPVFFDYLYVSLTNAAAFSPTDTMPLSLRAKGLMGVQSIASLITVALVAARAVNILS
jgi:hypothetical protein